MRPCSVCKGLGILGVSAFTIGSQKAYDRDLATLEVNKKIGVRDDYGGGWVWRTAEEAQAFIDTHPELAFTAKVYGLVLPRSWEADVSPEPEPEDGVHRLLNDANLVQLP